MFALADIYQYLTKKQIDNADIQWYEPSPKEKFLSEKNMAKLASQMYRQLPAESQNNYFQYKSFILPYMKKWIVIQSLPAIDINPNRVNILELNNNFIKKHKFLFEKSPVYIDQNNQVKPVIDNVFKQKIVLSEYDPITKTMIKTIKSSKNLTPEDYGKLDLWKEKTVYFDYDFVNKWKSFRQWGHANPVIPRHVDRSNEGLQCRDPARASLTQPQRGYDMSEWYRAKGI